MTGADLKPYNTLALSAIADEVVVVREADDLQRCRREHPPEKLLVLGEGSNVVLAPRLERTVCLMRIAGREITYQDTHARVRVGAGENWHELVMGTLAQELFGLENLALIPGSVGAAPVQNIGAYGVELESLLESVTAVDLVSGRVHELDVADCGLGYRDSIFKRQGSRLAITAVVLRLSRKPNPVLTYPDLRVELGARADRAAPQEVAHAVMRIRRRKLPDPAMHPNVGSFFKNPVLEASAARELLRKHPDLKTYPADGGRKLAAAQLIDLAGWKRKPRGRVGVWPAQPLVLVNHGTSDGREVLAVATAIQKDVAARFGVRLELEPDAIGF